MDFSEGKWLLVLTFLADRKKRNERGARCWLHWYSGASLRTNHVLTSTILTSRQTWIPSHTHHKRLQGAWGLGPPLPPSFVFKSCSFQAILREKPWGQTPLGLTKILDLPLSDRRPWITLTHTRTTHTHTHTHTHMHTWSKEVFRIQMSEKCSEFSSWGQVHWDEPSCYVFKVRLWEQSCASDPNLSVGDKWLWLCILPMWVFLRTSGGKESSVLNFTHRLDSPSDSYQCCSKAMSGVSLCSFTSVCILDCHAIRILREWVFPTQYTWASIARYKQEKQVQLEIVLTHLIYIRITSQVRVAPLLPWCPFTVPSNQKLQGSRGVTTVCLVYSGCWQSHRSLQTSALSCSFTHCVDYAWESASCKGKVRQFGGGAKNCFEQQGFCEKLLLKVQKCKMGQDIFVWKKKKKIHGKNWWKNFWRKKKLLTRPIFETNWPLSRIEQTNWNWKACEFVHSLLHSVGNTHKAETFSGFWDASCEFYPTFHLLWQPSHHIYFLERQPQPPVREISVPL